LCLRRDFHEDMATKWDHPHPRIFYSASWLILIGSVFFSFFYKVVIEKIKDRYRVYSSFRYIYVFFNFSFFYLDLNVDIMILFFSFLSKQTKKRFKEEVKWGCFVGFRLGIFLHDFTQPSQCERMIAQRW